MHHAISITTLVYKAHLLAFHFFTQKKVHLFFLKSIPIFHNKYPSIPPTVQTQHRIQSPHSRKQILIYTQTYPSPKSEVRGPVNNAPPLPEAHF